MSSPYSQIQCGVPQGSILGPVLFLVYINDIANSTKAFQFRLFADDTNLFKYLKSNSVDLMQIGSEFQKVCDWCKANKLTINIDKTNYMIIKTPHKHVTMAGNLNIDGHQLDCVSSTTYLGVTLDHNINWKLHIQKIVKTIAPKAGIIAQLRHYVPKHILLLLYNSLILPHISYCIEIWGNTFTTFLEPLLILQKKITRLITFSDFHAHTEPLFKQLGILDVHKLCKFHTCLFVFDLLNNHFAQDKDRYLLTIPHDYPTRFSVQDNFYIPKISLSQSKHHIKYAATNHWNSLPSHIKSINQRHKFKKELIMSSYVLI